MRNFKINLYGNIIVDHIYCIDSFKGLIRGGSNESVSTYRELGAIGNVVRALNGLDEQTQIYAHGCIGNDHHGDYVLERFKELGADVSGVQVNDTLNTSSAVIIPDLTSQERTSIVDWGACTQVSSFEETDSDWNHFMYIDTLKNLSAEDLKKFKGTVSADVCLSNIGKENRQRILTLLPYIDYLIISLEEATLLIQENQQGAFRTFNEIETTRKLGSLCRKSAVVHHAQGSYTSNGESVYGHVIDRIKRDGLNVLGAGDYFASGLIYSLLSKNELEMKEHVINAHDCVKNLLLNE